MITISESSTPEIIILPTNDVLVETVVVGAVIETSATAVAIITETTNIEILTTIDPGDVIVVEEDGFVIEVPCGQGPMGPAGSGFDPSSLPNADNNPIPSTVIVKQNGNWVLASWAQFTTWIGSVTPTIGVTVNGVSVTVNGETITVNGA